MQDKIKILSEYLKTSLTIKSRVVILISVIVLAPTFFLPLWQLEFGAQQYPEGLEMFIYPDRMEGGDDGNDLTEINVLNHYIGMAELSGENFTEFQWIPLIIGLILVLALRAAVVGDLKSIIDLLVFMFYFAVFSLWRFWYMLSSYGHNLDPKAAVKVDPFTPPVFGTKMVGQFTVESYPAIGSYLFMLFALLIVLSFWFTFKDAKKN
jgi:hypothetical protein